MKKGVIKKRDLSYFPNIKKAPLNSSYTCYKHPVFTVLLKCIVKYSIITPPIKFKYLLN